MEYRMNFKMMMKRRRRGNKKKIMMIIMKMNYKEEEEEQTVGDLVGSGTFIPRNKTGSYTAPTNGKHNFLNLYLIFNCCRLCGPVVRVSGYRYRGLGFDSRRYQIF